MNHYAPLIVLFVILVIGAVVSQLWLTDPKWKNLIFGVAATITVVILIVWILQVLGVWHAPVFGK